MPDQILTIFLKITEFENHLRIIHLYTKIKSGVFFLAVNNILKAQIFSKCFKPFTFKNNNDSNDEAGLFFSWQNKNIFFARNKKQLGNNLFTLHQVSRQLLTNNN